MSIFDPPVSLVDCQLVPGSGYRDVPAVTGSYVTDEFFPSRLDLDQLQ